MAKALLIHNGDTKEQRYQALLPQIGKLISDETNLIANLANLAAALKQGMNYFWVDFYLVRGEELILSPF